jgi:hypothetical protein
MNHAPNLGDEFQLPLATGLFKGDDTQIISATGWEVGWIKLSPAKDIADHIVKCVNARDELAEALQAAHRTIEFLLPKADPQLTREEGDAVSEHNMRTARVLRENQ